MLNSASAATSSISSIESEADLLFHQNRHHQSNSILLAVVPQYHNSSYLHFMIGRNYLYQNLLAEAENVAYRCNQPQTNIYVELL